MLWSGDVPAEDPHDGHLLRDHAAQGPQSPPVGGPGHPVHGGQCCPAAAPRQQGVEVRGDGTEPPRRSRGRCRVVRHVRLRGGLLREDPEGHEAESVAAQRSARIHRRRVWSHHGDNQRRRQAARQELLLRLRLGRVVRHLSAVVRWSPGRCRRQVRRQHSEGLRH